MPSDKLFTAKEAAVAVLKKAEEMLKKAELAKKSEDPSKMSGKTGLIGSGESGHEMGVHTRGNKGSSHGISSVGARLRDIPHVSEKEGNQIKAHAKESHKTMIAEMKAAPKPAIKSEDMSKGEEKKENAKPSEHKSKDADQHAEGDAPKGEIKPKEKEQAPSDDAESQKAPQDNSKEEKEGNNPEAGSAPEDMGKHAGDDGVIDQGDLRGHLKLAKFIGRMEHKRGLKKSY